MATIPAVGAGGPELPSGEPEVFGQTNVWNDAVLIEESPTKDNDAFPVAPSSLVDDVEKWVVYFKGKRLGLFRKYAGALDNLGVSDLL